MNKIYSEEVIYCINYLASNGVTPEEYALLATSTDVASFELVRKQKDASFFTELADKLRELWPPGEKDGKYPWRDSTKNIAKRLEILWKERGLHDFTIDDCLVQARRYLANFENDTRYMKILRKFIVTQKSIVMSDGRIKYVNESMLADMLEGKKEFEKTDDEWNNILNSEMAGEGELI